MSKSKTFSHWLELKGRSKIPAFARRAIEQCMRNPDVRYAKITAPADQPGICYVEFWATNGEGSRSIIDMIEFTFPEVEAFLADGAPNE